MSRNSRLKATAKRRSKSSKGASKSSRRRQVKLELDPGNLPTPINALNLLEQTKKESRERSIIERGESNAEPVDLLEQAGGEA